MKKIVSIIKVVLMLMLLMLLLCACQKEFSLDRPWDNAELTKCEGLYVHNVTCSGNESVRTTDVEYKNAAAKLCANVEAFREVTSADTILGSGAYDPYIVFAKDDLLYLVNMFDFQEQLSLDYIYRDEPLVLVTIMHINSTNGAFETDWQYYCKMSAKDYAALFNYVQTYGGGEVLDSIPH